MDTVEESVCCHSKLSKSDDGNKFVSMVCNLQHCNFLGECITGHEMFHKLLDPMVLEVNLRLLYFTESYCLIKNIFRSVWSAGVQDTQDKEISNE